MGRIVERMQHLVESESGITINRFAALRNFGACANLLPVLSIVSSCMTAVVAQSDTQQCAHAFNPAPAAPCAPPSPSSDSLASPSSPRHLLPSSGDKDSSSRRPRLLPRRRADRAEARDIFKQLIEINTTDTAEGNVTTGSAAMEKRFLDAGFAREDVLLLGP